MPQSGKISNPRETFSIAECFHTAAMKLMPDDITDGNIMQWFVPLAVNLSLSCELYLKSLLLSYEIKLRTHKLCDLLYALPIELKTEITNGLLLHYSSLEEIDSLLKMHNDVFVDWRYIYEHETGKQADIVFLINFSNILAEIAEIHVRNKHS